MKKVLVIVFLVLLMPLAVFAGTLEVKDSIFEMKVEGESYKSKSPTLNVGGTTYLPLRELSEIFGKGIKYENNTIYIDS